jgi:tetratricopeptide (TPR) repeat protein
MAEGRGQMTEERRWEVKKVRAAVVSISQPATHSPHPTPPSHRLIFSSSQLLILPHSDFRIPITTLPANSQQPVFIDKAKSNDYLKKLLFIEEVILMSENIVAIKLFDDGVAAYLRNDFKTSIKYFSRALKHDRKFALVYSSRGAAYLKTNKIDRAISDFTRAIRLDPAYARAFHLRGLAHEKAGEVARAYRDFDHAIEIDPDLAAAYRSRDSVLDKEVDDRRDFEDFEMAEHLKAMTVALFTGEKKAA